MLQVSISDFKANVGKYIDMAAEDDLCIMQDGKPAAKLTRPDKDRVATAMALFDILPAGTDLEAAKDERFR